MPDPIASQQAAIEVSIGSAQRIAMRIVDLPKDKREAGIEFVRREYEDALEKFGIDGEQARAWLELQIKEIRSLISEIEASGTALADKIGAS
jgi:aspartyl-tRNA synthetase